MVGYGNAVSQYQQVKVQAGVQSGDPHHLVALLFEGALAKIHGAKARIAYKGSLAEKGQLIGGAVSIIDALRASLDKERGGEIAENLERLYIYMTGRLLEANLKNDIRALDEVIALLKPIDEAWKAIGQEAGRVNAAVGGGR